MYRLHSGNGGVVQKAASKPSLQAAKHILTALQRLPKCTVFSHQSEKEILHEQAAEKIWLSCLYCTHSKIPNLAQLQQTTCQHIALLPLQLPLHGKWDKNRRAGSW